MQNKQPNPNAKLSDGIHGVDNSDSDVDMSRPIWQSTMVSLGDYMAGSSHVLPTGQQAKFGAGLGVHSFLRAQQIIDYSELGLAPIAELVTKFANAEGLPAHGEAVTARFND